MFEDPIDFLEFPLKTSQLRGLCNFVLPYLLASRCWKNSSQYYFPFYKELTGRENSAVLILFQKMKTLFIVKNKTVLT